MTKITKNQLSKAEINYYNFDEIYEKFYNLLQLKRINKFIKDGVLKKESKNYLKILHNCTKKAGYQISYFTFKNNNWIATGDIIRPTLQEIIEEF